MADATTPNLGLVKMQPGTHRDDWGQVANANLDKIDAGIDAASDAAAAAAGAAAGKLPLTGGTVTGEILRQGQGAVVHWAGDALDDGTMFLTPSGAPSPLTAPGQVWFGYSA